MKKPDECFSDHSDLIRPKIYQYRQKALRSTKPYSSEELDKPVAFWSKPDRLRDKVGRELTIILRTRGCKWALSESGGCSMCGYLQDAATTDVATHKIQNQFDYALDQKLEEIKTASEDFVLKIFNSGSFFDESEVPPAARQHIYERINSIPEIKEVIVESRPEFLSPPLLADMKDALDRKTTEIGIGVETVNDYIRVNYINKGFLFEDFKKAYELCREYEVGVKAYLLFKPAFMNEQGAIDDCVASIKTLVDMKMPSISVNPMNIQKGSLVEYLWHQHRYRPPWYYSLFKVFRRALSQEALNTTRILCDPSGAGSKRGIHNCRRRECNESMREILEEFILSQNLEALEREPLKCACRQEYVLKYAYL